MKPVLLLDCYYNEGSALPTFQPYLRVPELVHVRAPRVTVPTDAAEFSGIIVTGSSASVIDPKPWIEATAALLRDATDKAVPVLGVCFGHQVLAWALSGAGSVRYAPRPEVGWLDVDLVGEDPLFAGFDRRFPVFLSHMDEVRPDLPGLRLLAESPGCEVQAFRVGDKPLWGVQFHAEFDKVEAEEAIRSRAKKHPELKIDPEAMLAGALDQTATAHRLFGNFMDLARIGHGNEDTRVHVGV